MSIELRKKLTQPTDSFHNWPRFLRSDLPYRFLQWVRHDLYPAAKTPL